MNKYVERIQYDPKTGDHWLEDFPPSQVPVMIRVFACLSTDPRIVKAEACEWAHRTTVEALRLQLVREIQTLHKDDRGY